MFEYKKTEHLTLEQKLDILMSERDIRNVIHRECRSKSRADGELMKSCYWEDALDHHGPFFDARISDIIDAFPEKIPEMGRVVQYIAQQILIDLDGDVARVETHVQSNKLFHERSEDGHDIVRISGMRMLDRFERRGGEWRIAERWFVPEWGVFVEQPALQHAISSYGVGTDAAHIECNREVPVAEHRFDRTDPSYTI